MDNTRIVSAYEALLAQPGNRRCESQMAKAVDSWFSKAWTWHSLRAEREDLLQDLKVEALGTVIPRLLGEAAPATQLVGTFHKLLRCRMQDGHRNRCRRAKRETSMPRTESGVEVEFASNQAGPEDLLVAKEVRLSFQRALAALKGLDGALALRLLVEGQKPAEAARDLGLAVNEVYRAKDRILYRLRQDLADFAPAA